MRPCFPTTESLEQASAASRLELDADLHCDQALADPYPLYRRIPDFGAAVWLPAHGIRAIDRFADIRAALLADSVLLSGHGVSSNAEINAQAGRVTLTTDGDIHRQLRPVVMRPRTRAMLARRENIELGKTQLRLSNVLHGYGSFPARFLQDSRNRECAAGSSAPPPPSPCRAFAVGVNLRQ
ncbi:MAG TPA: hypothetical protein VGK20_13300 [Candidatus Binatia bacterium]